jgi:hypothetical protein
MVLSVRRVGNLPNYDYMRILLLRRRRRRRRIARTIV